jgi:membrane associated rhomboid family serine protease
MTARQLAREIRDYPATVSLCLIWLVIFGVHTYGTLVSSIRPLTLAQWLVTGFGGGDRYGDLSLRAIDRAEYWRLLTCTFVHYSLLHVSLNVLAMYQLGTMVESWYGSARLLVIYALTGGGGNLISTLIRQGIGSDRNVHSAGGSVVILGLVGMCAIAGWRSKRRMGRLLARQMAIVLFVTALLGLALPMFIDNWGHAGGAIVGAAIGFFHPRLMTNLSKPSTWGAGLVAVLIMAGCGLAQLIDNRRHEPALMERTLIARSDFLMVVEGTLNAVGRVALGRGSPLTVQEMLLSREHQVQAPVRDEIAELRERLARGGPHSEADQAEIHRLTAHATSLLLESYERILDDRSRAEIEQLRPLIEVALLRPLTRTEGQEFKERLAQANREILREYKREQGKLRDLRSSRKSPIGAGR